jgi:hypothetical protein
MPSRRFTLLALSNEGSLEGRPAFRFEWHRLRPVLFSITTYKN